jgi:hypothetical protein
MNLPEIIFLAIYGLVATYLVRFYRGLLKAELREHARSKSRQRDNEAIIAMYERHMTAHGMKIYKNGVQVPAAEESWPEELN